MAYQQFTKCCSKGDYVPLGYATVGIVVGLFLSMLAGITLALSTLSSVATVAVAILLAVAVAVDVTVIAFCIGYLYHRLICLSPLQHCVIGMVNGISPPIFENTRTKLGDNDYTIDILLAPGPTHLGEDLSSYQNQVQGQLLTEQDGLPYADPAKESSRFALHCEFEGSGVYDLLEFASAILVFLLAILVLLSLELAVPALVPIVTLLEILAGLLGLAGLITPQLPSSKGDPTEENIQLGELSPGDIVFVAGDWIYDGGHAGWNEIHPIHSCQIIWSHERVQRDVHNNPLWPTDIGGGLGLDTGPKVKQAIAAMCEGFDEATVAETGGSRTDPTNNWIVHPLVDGCKKSPVIV